MPDAGTLTGTALTQRCGARSALASSSSPFARAAREVDFGGTLTNAVGGGIYGLSGAPGVPVEWLEHTPFPSYVIPSLILPRVMPRHLLATLGLLACAACGTSPIAPLIINDTYVGVHVR